MAKKKAKAKKEKALEVVEEIETTEGAETSKPQGKIEVQFVKSAQVGNTVQMIGSTKELTKSEVEELSEYIKIIN